MIDNVVSIEGDELGLFIVLLIKDIEYKLRILKDYDYTISIDGESNILIE